MSWQEIARAVAPTLATAIAGPLGGVAATVVAQTLFGDDPAKAGNATPAQVIAKIGAASTTQDIEKLKQAEQDLKKFEADNNFRFAQLDENDRVDARKMRASALASGNETADRLSWLVIISFLVVGVTVLIGCGLILKGVVQLNPNNASLYTAISGLIGGVVGYFSANANQVVGFYFGSSSASAKKSDQLASTTQTAIDAIVQNQVKPTVTKTETGGMTVTTANGEPAADKLALSNRSLTGETGGDVMPPGMAATGRSLATASARFDACVTYVLEREGGYSDKAADKGGPTNFGITQHVLAGWRHQSVVTPEAVKALTQSEAKAIYRANYWNAAGCDGLPAGVDLSVFDSGIMSGTGQGVKFVQQAAGLQGDEVDGAVGKQTLAAVTAVAAGRLIDGIAGERLAFYEAIVARDATQAVFLDGWKNRVGLTQARAQSMSKMWS